MGGTASSSSGDSGGLRPATPPPPPLSSSSSSAASNGAVGSTSSGSLDATVEVDVGSQSSKFRSPSHSLSSSSSGSSALLQLATVGDASDSLSASSSGSTGASSCSDDQVEISAVTSQPSDWTAADRCPYYPPRSDGCTEPRLCRDCLNMDVGGDYSCMVNQYGRCVQKNPSTYVKALDVKHQQPSNGGEACEDQKVQFPADEVDYCTYDDKNCKYCRDSAFEDVMDGRINGSLTKFCYGETGCVCIAVCEAPMWKSTIGMTVCNGTVVNQDYESEHANTNGGSSADGHGGQGIGSLMLEIVGGLAAVVVLVAAVQYARKRRRMSEDGASGSSSNSGSAQAGTQEGGEDGPVPMAVPVAAPHLSLFGWQAMRSELIEREQLLLAGVEDFSNVRTGYLQLLDVDASAPPQEEDESSAPVLLVPLAGASAPSFSPRGVAAFASAPSAPPVSPSAPPASPSLLEEELL